MASQAGEKQESIVMQGTRRADALIPKPPENRSGDQALFSSFSSFAI